MTEVPEYLLERSRARRAALGLGGGGGAEGAAPASEPAGTPAATTDVSVGAAPAAIATAPPPAAAVAAAPPAPVRDRGPRSGVPPWMMPVILLLPLWAIVYMGAFGQKATTGPLTPEQLGAQVFQKAGCVSCHGATGGGGVGPKLAGGEVSKTFPDAKAQEAFVKQGSGPIKGQPYGDPNRPGGQHIAKSGGMPTFGGQLSDEEIAAVVLHERGL